VIHHDCQHIDRRGLCSSSSDGHLGRYSLAVLALGAAGETPLETHGARMVLEARQRRDSLPFHALIGAASGEVLIVFRAAAGPGDYYSINEHSIDCVALAESEGHGQFRLRQIARSAFHEPRLA